MNQTQKTDWIINSLLATILALLVVFYSSNGEQKAFAAGGGWDTNGVMAMTTNGPNNYLVLVDTNKHNIMVYRTQGAGEFRLVGARSYKYDVEMQDTAGSTVEKNGITADQVHQIYEEHKNKK